MSERTLWQQIRDIRRMIESLTTRVESLEGMAHPPVTPIVSEEEFDHLALRVDHLERVTRRWSR